MYNPIVSFTRAPSLTWLSPLTARISLQDLVLGMTYFGIGMAPIGALCLTIFGLWSLTLGTLLTVVPAVLTALVLGRLYPAFGRLAALGLLIGVIAVTAYDCVRLPFILAGLWGDFIPKIGGWLLGTDVPNTALGYLWRFLGNGGGMGLACVMLYALWTRLTGRDGHPLLFCTGYGIVIWGCLLLTVLASPRGEDMLFKLTTTSFILSFVGHVVYGATIGLLIKRWQPSF